MPRIDLTVYEGDGIYYRYEIGDGSLSWNQHEIETLPDGSKRLVDAPDELTITIPLDGYEIVTNDPAITDSLPA